MSGLKINKLVRVTGTFSGTSTDPILTSNVTTGAVDTASSSLGSLASGKIWIGSGGNLPVAQTLSGAITVSTAGVTTLTPIVNADVNASAAITLTKLAATTASRALVSDGSGFISPATTTSTEIGYVNGVTSAIQTQINAKQATITGAATTVVSSNLSNSIVVVSDGSGKIASSAVSTTALGYISTLSSAAQTQLNTKLTTSLGTLATGDIIYYNGFSWTNLPRGTNGQALYSTAGSIQWNTPTINGIPVGGTANQYLAKNSGTDFDVSWNTLTLSKVTDVTSTAAELNTLHGVTTTTAQFNYLNTATSDIQTQLNNKLANTLANNAIFVGNSSNVPTGYAAGSNGQVLQIVAGVPTWQTLSGTGTVTSVDVSGGTTGLTTSGGPVTTTGTITFAGTLIAANGGTGFASYTVGDLIQATTTTTFAKLAAVATGNVLISGGVGTVSSWGKVALTTHVSGILPVANGGTGTSTAFTTGDLVFAGASGIYTHDAGINYDNSSKFLTLKNLNSSLGNTVIKQLRLSGQTTLTPGAGIGSRIEFETQTAAGPTLKIGSLVDSVSTDITGGSEDFDLVFSNMAAGASATEGFRVLSTGDVKIGSGVAGSARIIYADGTAASVDLVIETRASSALAEQFRITSDGRVYGKSIHNNSGSVTGTTNQYIASGTYSPTITSISNLDSSSGAGFMWTRVGNIVQVSGELTLDATTGGGTTTEVAITLPIASNLVNSYDLNGCGTTMNLLQEGSVYADVTNDRALFRYLAQSSTAAAVKVVFMYVVL